MKSLLASLSIGKKLTLAVLLPALGLAYFASYLVIDAWQHSQQTQALERLTTLAKVSSEWVHELQKERGMSAGFLGSKGNKFADSLPKQRLLADAKQLAFQAHIAKETFDPTLTQLNQSIISQAKQLNNMRNKVNSLSVSVADEVAYYTQLNTQLLSTIDSVANQNTNVSLAIEAVALGAFLQHKERAGIERAVLSTTFAADKFLPGFYERFVRLLAEQDAYMDKFLAHRPDLKTYLNQTLQHPDITKVNTLRQLALSKATEGQFNQDPEAWFAAITTKINLLKTIEDKLVSEFEQKNRQIIAEQQNALWSQIAISLSCLLISIWLSYYISTQLTRTIADSVKTIRFIIKEKNFSARIAVNSTDEISAIATLVNQLLDNVEGLFTQIKTSSETLACASIENKQLTNSMLQQVSGGMTQIELVVTAMHEMSATVQDIAHNAVQASEQTELATSQASHGDDEVNATVDAIASLQAEMQKAMAVVTELNQSATEIDQFLDVIKSISEQTNLLALNAAIEAARAGESGRGFAVVADEVRSLSTQTRSSTEKIEVMTHKLKKGASEAVSAMERGMAKVVVSVDEAKRAGSDISEIVSNIKAISLMNIQVATAAEEQSSVTEEISRNVTDMQGNFVQIDHSSQQLERVNNNLTQLAQQLEHVIKQYQTSDA